MTDVVWPVLTPIPTWKASPAQLKEANYVLAAHQAAEYAREIVEGKRVHAASEGLRPFTVLNVTAGDAAAFVRVVASSDNPLLSNAVASFTSVDTVSIYVAPRDLGDKALDLGGFIRGQRKAAFTLAFREMLPWDVDREEKEAPWRDLGTISLDQGKTVFKDPEELRPTVELRFMSEVPMKHLTIEHTLLNVFRHYHLTCARVCLAGIAVFNECHRTDIAGVHKWKWQRMFTSGPVVFAAYLDKPMAGRYIITGSAEERVAGVQLVDVIRTRNNLMMANVDWMTTPSVPGELARKATPVIDPIAVADRIILFAQRGFVLDGKVANDIVSSYAVILCEDQRKARDYLRQHSAGIRKVAVAAGLILDGNNMAPPRPLGAGAKATSTLTSGAYDAAMQDEAPTRKKLYARSSKMLRFLRDHSKLCRSRGWGVVTVGGALLPEVMGFVGPSASHEEFMGGDPREGYPLTVNAAVGLAPREFFPGF